MFIFHYYSITADSATMIEVDHEAQEVSVEQLRGFVGDINGIPPPRESVNARLNTQVTSTNINMDKISFERNKSGIWGWRSDKMETINGYDCKVYAASNVELVTRTRSDHLNEQQARVMHAWNFGNITSYFLNHYNFPFAILSLS